MHEQEGTKHKEDAGEPRRRSIHQRGRKEIEGHSSQRTDEAHQVTDKQGIARYPIDEIDQQLQQRQLISQEDPIGIHDADQSVSAIDRRMQMNEPNSNEQPQEENGQEL